MSQQQQTNVDQVMKSCKYSKEDESRVRYVYNPQTGVQYNPLSAEAPRVTDFHLFHPYTGEKFEIRQMLHPWQTSVPRDLSQTQNVAQRQQNRGSSSIRGERVSSQMDQKRRSSSLEHPRGSAGSLDRSSSGSRNFQGTGYDARTDSGSQPRNYHRDDNRNQSRPRDNRWDQQDTRKGPTQTQAQLREPRATQQQRQPRGTASSSSWGTVWERGQHYKKQKHSSKTGHKDKSHITCEFALKNWLCREED